MLWSDHFVTSASRDLTLTQIVFRVSAPAFCLLNMCEMSKFELPGYQLVVPRGNRYELS